MKLIEDKHSKYLIKFLTIMLPMLIVPMVSYEFLIQYFNHFTVIYSGFVVGFMVGIIIILTIDKIPRRKLWKRKQKNSLE